MPLIKCITLPALQEEDWRQIKEAVDIETMDRDQITVEKFTDYKLHDHLQVIEEIASSAQRKANLNKKLKDMKDELKEFKLQHSTYPRVNPFTHVLKEYDEVITKLEDQLVQTQGILGQLGAKAQKSALKRDAETWEKKLRQLSDLVDEIQRCQRIWMYLEPIFASDDIAKTLPEEYANF
jgi:dynein heavy chain